jgi:N-acetylmuramoyl-L-alanine amidase
MRPVAALAVAAMALWAQAGKPAPHSVTAVRHWSLGTVTRIAVEVSGEFEYRSDQLHNPERVYYDITNSRPKFDNKRLYTEDLDDPFVKRVRVAETVPGVTRVVLDLNGTAEATASVLSSPDRLIVELRAAGPATDQGAPPAMPAPVPAAPAVAAPPPPTAPATTTPAVTTPAIRTPGSVTPSIAAPPVAAPGLPAPPVPVKPIAIAPPTPAPEAADTATAPATVKPDTTKAAAQPPAEVAKPARHTSAGSTSLVRALGLKIQRVVIDPGHGGHDEGTQGPKGLLEKDLVLDVAMRVGKLIEDRMGAEVIYTRSDDTFVPLEGRTALANDKKADLFLSIHANSSPTPHVTGVETYYLNFTDSKDALDVASRENASSQKSIFELRDLIERISAHDKAEESRDFASRIQTALFAFSTKTFPAEKNRGVRKAPFVVLIGANMPSVLAEIGFLSNPREEALLKKPDYRQKLAEALYRGVSKYADGLSHFQVAEN